MANDPSNTGTFDVPVGELVRSLASAVVEAQLDLDRNAMRVAEMMSGQQVQRDPVTDQPVYQTDEKGRPVLQMLDSRVFFGSVAGPEGRTPIRLSMLELGFAPTFYQFVETTIEVRIALRLNRQQNEEGRTTTGITGTPVDAQYSQTYSYNADSACLFKTKMVPIPAPGLLEQRIRLLLEAQKAEGGS